MRAVHALNLSNIQMPPGNPLSLRQADASAREAQLYLLGLMAQPDVAMVQQKAAWQKPQSAARAVPDRFLDRHLA